MSKYKVNYKVNHGPMKGETIAVEIEGNDVEDVKARFERTSDILYSDNKELSASIITISEV